MNRKLKKIGPADAAFVLDDYVFYNLMRTSFTYNNEMSLALDNYDLDTSKWRILMLLHDRSPSSVGDLAHRSMIKMPTLTRMLTRMEDEGLVLRQALKEDRRVINVTMTPKASKTLKTVRSIGQNLFERAFDGVSPQDMAVVIKTLKRVRGNLTRSPYHDADDAEI